MLDMTKYRESRKLEDSLWRSFYEPPKKLVFGNGKTLESFRSLLRLCKNRTPTCTSVCYACCGPISWTPSIKKAVSVRKWIEENGTEKAAKRLVSEIKVPYFRWMDRGDFDELYLDLLNKVVFYNKYIKHAAFSRDINILNGMDKSISRIYSADRDNIHKYPINSGILLAYLKVEIQDNPTLDVDIVFPKKGDKNLLGHPKQCNFYEGDGDTSCLICRRCWR